jgi:hypothetical protein
MTAKQVDFSPTVVGQVVDIILEIMPQIHRAVAMKVSGNDVSSTGYTPVTLKHAETETNMGRYAPMNKEASDLSSSDDE